MLKSKGNKDVFNIEQGTDEQGMMKRGMVNSG